jgi:hypothetical protein
MCTIQHGHADFLGDGFRSVITEPLIRKGIKNEDLALKSSFFVLNYRGYSTITFSKYLEFVVVAVIKYMPGGTSKLTVDCSFVLMLSSTIF